MAVSREVVEIVGLRRLQRKVRRLQSSALNRPLMADIGLFAMTRIKQRTQEGRDAHGIPFEPYSPQYALFRQSTGHPVNRVNLHYSGSMMSAMTFEPDSDKVELFFMNTTDPSGTENPKKAFFLNESREFFALSEEDVRGIMDIVQQYYNRLIR